MPPETNKRQPIQHRCRYNCNRAFSSGIIVMIFMSVSATFLIDDVRPTLIARALGASCIGCPLRPLTVSAPPGATRTVLGHESCQTSSLLPAHNNLLTLLKGRVSTSKRSADGRYRSVQGAVAPLPSYRVCKQFQPPRAGTKASFGDCKTTDFSSETRTR